MESQLCAGPGKLVQFQDQFQKCKTQNENLRKKKKVLEKQYSKIGKPFF